MSNLSVLITTCGDWSSSLLRCLWPGSARIGTAASRCGLVGLCSVCLCDPSRCLRWEAMSVPPDPGAHALYIWGDVSPVALSKCCVHRQQLEDNFWLANFSQIDLPIKESECLHPPQFPRGRPLSSLPSGVRGGALLLSAKVYSHELWAEARKHQEWLDNKPLHIWTFNSCILSVNKTESLWEWSLWKLLCIHIGDISSSCFLPPSLAFLLSMN